MIQKTIWNKFLELMNSSNTILLILFSSLIIGCECEDCTGNGNYPIKATIYFFNQSNDSIISAGCNRDLAVNETYKQVIRTSLGIKVNDVEEFPVSIFTNCSMKYKIADGFKCEQEIYNINSYENKKQLESIKDTLVFELTFRFTEERKSMAKDCN